MALDDELEHAAATIRRIEVTPPSLDRARSRLRRRRARRGGAVALVMAVAAIASVAVTSPDDDQPVIATPPPTAPSRQSRVTVVPWVDETTTTYVEPTMPAVPPSAPPCRRADVRVDVGEATKYPGNPTAHVLVFTNVGSAACSLTGRPTVRAVGGDGHEVTATPVDLLPEIAGPVVETDVLPVGTYSVAALWTPADCSDTPATNRIRVSFGDGPVTVIAAPTDRGDSGSERDGFVAPVVKPIPTGCGLQVGAFSVATVGQPSVLRSAYFLEYRVEAPAEVRAGSALTATLAVRNPTGRPLRLAPCPRYQGALQPETQAPVVTDVVRLYGALRCAGLPAIEPGTTVEFRLHVVVPADAPTGPAHLWLVPDPPLVSPLVAGLSILPA
jgi:hypothetical protein